MNQTLMKSKNSEIFYLTWDELEKFLTNEISLNETVILIQKAKEKYLIDSKRSKVEVTDTHSRDTLNLKGIGVCMGKAYGRAVIIEKYEDLKNLKHGDILIAKIIDSGWTPVFNIISGLVTEVGGMLSHASVVAREIGIPAITSATNATQLLKTGMKVEINGKTGEIKIMR